MVGQRNHARAEADMSGSLQRLCDEKLWVRDDLEAAGPTKVSEVEAAQKEILVIARRMAEAGEIVLGGSGEEML